MERLATFTRNLAFMFGALMLGLWPVGALMTGSLAPYTMPNTVTVLVMALVYALIKDGEANY